MKNHCNLVICSHMYNISNNNVKLFLAPSNFDAKCQYHRSFRNLAFTPWIWIQKWKRQNMSVKKICFGILWQSKVWEEKYNSYIVLLRAKLTMHHQIQPYSPCLIFAIKADQNTFFPRIFLPLPFLGQNSQCALLH